MVRQPMRMSGFGLLELVVVIAIIGTLAALSIPIYEKYKVRSRRTEALNNVQTLYTLQEAYRAVTETYGELTSYGRSNCPAAVNEIGFELTDCANVRYQYYTTAHSETDFEAAAVSTRICKDASPDMVTVNSEKVINVSSCQVFSF